MQIGSPFGKVFGIKSFPKISLSLLSDESSFSPEILFASGETGAWYDPSDLTTLYTDTAGTTQASVGDPVALMLDKSGNDWHLPQGTVSRRPILREDSGLYYLEFDGVDDYMGLSSYSYGAPDNVEVFTATEYTAVQNILQLIFNFGGNAPGGYYISFGDTSKPDSEVMVRFNGATFWSVGETPVPAAPRKSVLYTSGQVVPSQNGRIWTRVNGVQYQEGDSDTLPYTWDRSEILYLGSFSSLYHFPGKFYGAITRGGTRSSDETVQAVEGYLATKSGTTL